MLGRNIRGSLADVLVPLAGGWMLVLVVIYFVFISSRERMEWFVTQSAPTKVIALAILILPVLVAGSLLTAYVVSYVQDYLESRRKEVIENE